MTTSTPLEWPRCGYGTRPDIGPVDCRGRRVDPYFECLAHLSDSNRRAYLTSLHPGADIDHCGTRFSRTLLTELLDALKESADSRPRLGAARFRDAEFQDAAVFRRARFSGAADFSGAKFSDLANFNDTEFEDLAYFSEASFSIADFRGLKAHRTAWFARAKFTHAIFGGVTFSEYTVFNDAEFQGEAFFSNALFERASTLGPLLCKGGFDLSEAVFGSAVTIEAATPRLRCQRTRWASTAALRLRYATVHLSDAVLEYPVSITTHSQPFASAETEVTGLDLEESRVRVKSLKGVDAAFLTLNDVDLSECLFSGTIHLDQLRLEGRYPMASSPPGLRWRGCLPKRWTPRRTLAEEQHWRASRATAGDGWSPAPKGVEILEPVALAPIYRQLRKAFEDGKHEPGAADFYYGEMEMRRNADDIPWSERALLTAYWALSGYGLRAARALGWLAVAMLTTILLMMGFGLPNESPKQQIVKEKIDGKWTTVIDKPDPKNPTGDRFTGKRFEKALNVTLNSVVFRSSGQDLTTAGTYIEMTSRLTEPILLGFAGLAIRGRVKRGS